MFLRRFERRKYGKPHSYWALVESYRTGKGSRQRVVSYLGELTADEQDGWTQFCSHLTGKAQTRQPDRALFDPPRRDHRDAHREADISGFDRGRVVDAVAGHGHDVFLRSEQLHKPRFVFRRPPKKADGSYAGAFIVPGLARSL
jgi:hypothetical protein